MYARRKHSCFLRFASDSLMIFVSLQVFEELSFSLKLTPFDLLRSVQSIETVNF
ncbi:MAG: hypothetical protein K0Q74_279 [Gammaproteobacteria bacterium]|jgi:hypothetical protein|nr:hypothetical protein [Gammaproteobacteria bacterium]